MAPRRVLLLLLVAAAASACPLLALSPAVVVRAARDPPSGNHVPVPAAAAETTSVQPPTANTDNAGVLGSALNNVPPHLIHPAVLADPTDAAIQRTVYDVTVIFRATARLGQPLLQYYVVPADGSAPISSGDGGDSKGTGDVGSILFIVGFFSGVFVGAVSVFLTSKLDLKDDEDEPAGDGGAIARNPDEVALVRVAGAAAKPRRGNY